MPLIVPIRKIMTTQVVKIEGQTPLKNIGKLFKENNFHHLPVVNKRNEIIGIISRADFSKIAYLMLESADEEQKEYLKELKATAIMTTHPFSLSPDVHLEKAMSIFLQNKIKAILIHEEEHLVGILTTYDIMNYLYQKLNSKEENQTIEEEDKDWRMLWEEYFS